MHGLQEDDATSSFEAKMAKLAGKEAGMFVMSGTMGNQLALRTHLQQVRPAERSGMHTS